MATQSLVFRNTTFNPVIRDNQPWLTAAEIGAALGYSDDKSIHRIYARNAAEFTVSMTGVVKLTTPGGKQEVRIFSLRGAHLIGMFARTKLAAEFRRWVLDILDQYTSQLPQSVEETLLPSEQQTLSEIVHKRAEGYGDLQGKVLAEYLEPGPQQIQGSPLQPIAEDATLRSHPLCDRDGDKSRRTPSR